MMRLDDKQSLLLEFVKACHTDQKRKYTHEPYWHHVYAVAEIVAEYEPSGIEIALCHDLLEDTECTESDLSEKLIACGYQNEKAAFIIAGVLDLTDQFTHEAYPDLNRKARKEKEAERLGNISYIAQTVKYADLINNSESITEHDKSFAKVYLSEKADMLKLMDQGHPELFKRCINILEQI
ncbi:hypothetical protein BFP97_11255 [Roseivirga sp. 4D4]|nr:hypothetical protein BFP97_11255 [Roseivirga sp. 4D4]